MGTDPWKEVKNTAKWSEKLSGISNSGIRRQGGGWPVASVPVQLPSFSVVSLFTVDLLCLDDDGDDTDGDEDDFYDVASSLGKKQGNGVVDILRRAQHFP